MISRCIPAVAALLVAFECAQAQQVFVVGSPQATVRGGASANVDIIEGGGSGDASGTVSVKYSTSLGTARKHYVKVDLTGQQPNTNGPLYIRYDTASNSQRQRVQVWSLDQGYPGMEETITWNTAQANDTASPSALLSSGAFTGTAYGGFLSASGANAVDVTHELHGPWGYMIQPDKTAYIVLSSIESIGDNGLRFVKDSVEIGFEAITAGSPPRLGLITNMLASDGTLVVIQGAYSAETNYFTVGDNETPLDQMLIAGESSNQASLPNGNILIEGTGADRRLYVRAEASGTPGTNTVVLSAYDTDGNRATRTFTVIVLAANSAPYFVVGGVTNVFPLTHTLVNTPLSIPFSFYDRESAGSALNVSASIRSYSGGVLSTAVLSDLSTSPKLTVTPQVGVDGVGVVDMYVADPEGNASSNSFCVMVRSNASVVFVDHFDYQGNNNRLTDDAPGLWTRRNSSAQSVIFRSATSPSNPEQRLIHLRPNAGAEDVGAPLAGGGFDAASRAVVYTRFQAILANTSGANTITNLDGDSAFFRLSEGPTASTTYVGEVALHDQGGTEFTFLTCNGGAPFVQWPASFTKPDAAGLGPLQIVTRYDVAAAKGSMWINGSAETNAHISGTDEQAVVSVGHVGFFQERGNGDIYIDDLVVTVEIRPLLTGAALEGPGSIAFKFNGAEWDEPGDFGLERAAAVGGDFESVAANITALGNGVFRATVSTGGEQGFYRVKRAPVVF